MRPTRWAEKRWFSGAGRAERIRYCLVTVGLSEQQSIAAADTYREIERREEIRPSYRNGRWCYFWPKSLMGSIVLRKNAWAGFPANKANICLRKRTVLCESGGVQGQPWHPQRVLH